MGPLKLTWLVLPLFAAAPARADPVANWRPLVAEASKRFVMPIDWIERVMRAESGGHTMLDERSIVSRAGAMGLMQLMPGTWAEMRARLGLGPDPHAPRDNIMAGTYYLRLMYDRFGYPGLFGAYNAGPGRYAEHVRSGRGLPSETRAYLASVAGNIAAAGRGDAASEPAHASNAIFFVLDTGNDIRRSEVANPAGLFVALRARPPETPATSRH
nr:lytic transglycosylase domain-containing protein [Sphingomonas sp. Y57]